MVRVAEGTMQIASAEAHKHNGCAGMETLALQGVEYLVDAVHD